jgi:hypothetical protein
MLEPAPLSHATKQMFRPSERQRADVTLSKAFEWQFAARVGRPGLRRRTFIACVGSRPTQETANFQVPWRTPRQGPLDYQKNPRYGPQLPWPGDWEPEIRSQNKRPRSDPVGSVLTRPRGIVGGRHLRELVVCRDTASVFGSSASQMTRKPTSKIRCHGQ